MDDLDHLRTILRGVPALFEVPDAAIRTFAGPITPLEVHVIQKVLAWRVAQVKEFIQPVLAAHGDEPCPI